MARLRLVQVDLLLAAGMILLPLLLYGAAAPGDWVDSPLAAPTAFVRQSLADGEIPLWNPHDQHGTPFTADGRAAFYYPFSWFLFLLPPNWGLGGYVVSQAWLAGVALFGFARLFGLRRRWAAAAGALYQVVGLAAWRWGVDPAVLSAAVWAPPLWGGLEMSLRRSLATTRPGQTFPWVVLAAAAFALQLLSGQMVFVGRLLLVTALFAVWRLVHHGRSPAAARQFALLLKSAVWLLAPFVLGAALAGMQLAPWYERQRVRAAEETADMPPALADWLATAPRAWTLPQTATAVADDPAAAMAQFDPRQYVLVAPADWDNGAATAGSLRPAAVTLSKNNELWLETAVAEPAWLVVGDSYFPGWRVFVRPLGGDDAQETELRLYRVNGRLRGALLPPGAWTIRQQYSPLSFQLGGLISLMAVAGIGFALAVWGWRQYYRPSGELSAARSVVKNSAVLISLNLLNRGIDFIFAAFYLRQLGPFDAGSFATAIAIATWFEIISQFGLGTLIVREVSRDRSQAVHYLVNSSVLRLATSLVAAIPIFLYVWGVGRAGNPLEANIVAAILFFMVGMLFSGLGQGAAGLFYAYESAERPAAVTTVATILKVALGVAALLWGYGFVGLAAVSILVNVITLLILTAMVARQFDLRRGWRLDFRLQGNMVKWSYPLMINHLFAVIFFQVDVPILQQFRGDAEVGWYNSAYKWVSAFNVIPSFFTVALFPVITRQIADSLADAQRTFRLAIKLMLALALPLAVVITFIAPALIQLLGGAAYLPHGAIALQLLIWSIPFGWLNGVTNYALIALGQERMQTRAFALGVGFNLITNLLFIPRYGYAAAAVTTILSELLLLLVFAYYLRPKMTTIRWLPMIWRPTAVAGLMLAGMWLAVQWHLGLALLVGGIVYLGGLWLFSPFQPQERRILSGVLPARFRRDA